MKYRIIDDEAYPIYYLWEDDKDGLVIPEDVLERHKKAVGLYRASQKELKKLFDDFNDS